MLFLTRNTVLPRSLAFAVLSILVACGGGGDDGPPAVANPQPPAQPAPPAPNGPQTPPNQPTDPAPTPEPGGSGTPRLEAAYTAISATTSFSQPNWPAWSRSVTASADGVGCARSETYHTHALLSVYRNGLRLSLPDSIGRGSGCNYEMHTHDGSGVIHLETDVPRTFTLGQFLSLWGQSIVSSSVLGLPGPARYYVIANEIVTPVTTDPAALVLNNHEEIVVVIGTPPAALPRYDWASSGL